MGLLIMAVIAHARARACECGHGVQAADRLIALGGVRIADLLQVPPICLLA